MTSRIALIGFGAIGRAVYRELARHDAARIVAVLLRQPDKLPPGLIDRALLVDGLPALLAHRPDLVVECAGHEAVDAHAVPVLQAGHDLMIVSVGALADRDRHARLLDSARSAQRQLILPAGAIGGIDWLAAARLAGLDRVVYRSRKPPRAWSGSAAEQIVDLGKLGAANTFFTGSAREAASRFPKNANVAATVALATLGLDDTRVELIADPSVTGNLHEVQADGRAGSISIKIDGHPDPDNPRTSMSTAFSVVRGILNRSAAVVI